MEENHNTILKQAVRAVLKPQGLLQKGSSRIWVDDNGWFFTIVEFQGSWCDKGSFLNVGMHHLWSDWESLMPVCGICDTRQFGWAGYKGDGEAFAQQVTALAETALARVLEYRKAADPKAAKIIPLVNDGIAPFWAAWNQLLTAALAGDAALCCALEREVFRKLEIIPIQGVEALLDQYLPLLNRPKQLQRRLLEKIASQRAFWRSKPGLKRLAVHPLYR